MGKYKALILDLDGTTVPQGYEHLPSDRVIQAIKSVQKKIPVCIATGRAYINAKPVLKKLGNISVCILSGGAVLYDLKKNEMIEKHTIPEEIYSKIIHDCKDLDDRFLICTTQGEHLMKDSYDRNETTGGFLIKLKDEEVDLYMKIMKKYPSISATVQTVTFTGEPVILFTDIHATKQRAIDHVIRLLKVKPEEIVAVGDGDNDLPMILAAGMGVAMGNASEGLKSIADYIAPSVQEDGVAHVIEKFFS